MVCQFYSPIIGGEEQLVKDLGTELVGRGHAVAVATIWHPGLPEFEQDHGVRIHRIRNLAQRVPLLFREPERRHAPPLPDLEAVSELRRVVASERPDIVHAHNWLVHSFLPLKSWSRARLVLTLHDYSLVCAKKRFMYRGAPCSGPGFGKCLACAGAHYGKARGPLTAMANGVMGAFERRSVDMFLPVSRAVAVGNGLVDSRLPYQVIPNFFVEEDTSTLPADRSTYLSQLPDGGFLLFVGDLSEDKGTAILLRAFSELKNAPPLVLIGRNHLNNYRSLRNVIILNSWPHWAVMEAWRRCSIALVPSLWAEPFGLVAIEAMSAGRPVIASRTGGLSDIVVDGETGILVPPGDPQALRQAIECLLDDPGLAERMGQAGKDKSNEFRASAIVPRIEQVYRQLVEQ